EMIQPTVFGQAIIIVVYVPILALHGVEGKMFHPMAMTVILALIGAFILSLTFVPAMIATFVSRKVAHKETAILRKIKEGYFEVLKRGLKHPVPSLVAAVALIAGTGVLFMKLGQEF